MAAPLLRALLACELLGATEAARMAKLTAYCSIHAGGSVTLVDIANVLLAIQAMPLAGGAKKRRSKSKGRR
jgi:hypothetical protein